METLKKGKFKPNYPINKLKYAKVNRDMTVNHAENFKTKLIDYGWMMPIVASVTGDVLEGHHRIESAKLLKQETVPAYIVDWVDTKQVKEHLDCIISLNNGNKAWSMFDYLKAFADQNEDYKIVYDAYMSNSNNVSVGNVINIFFTRGQHANNSKFKKGTAKIEDIKFANYLLHNISNLYEKYGRRRIQAYCVREFVKVAYAKAQKNKKAVEYLFKQYEKMAKRDHLAISSISEFKPILEVYLNDYKLMSK
jgi:hypothetical protein|tara:strand:+ start:21 stop:773 length:753 start_codon:yes stop_codon:yes gene_type:complete